MGKIGKIFALLLTLMAAISCLTLLITEPANAQSIPSPIPIPIPTIPEFTVQLVDRSYIVPASTTIDPYTGQNVTNPSYYAENRTAEIAIKNQLFTPYYENSTGAQWKITLMYQIRTKGHFAKNWTNLYFVEDGLLPASNSEYTTVSYSLGEGSIWGNLQTNAQVDFQLEAMIGYISRVYNPNATIQIEMYPWQFTGQTSGWSNIQTINLVDGSVSISSSPTATPTPTLTVPEFPTLIILPLFIIVILLSIVFLRKLKVNDSGIPTFVSSLKNLANNRASSLISVSISCSFPIFILGILTFERK